MDNEDFKAIAALAFQSASDPNWEDFYRKVCRWFSKNFSVPLPQVEEMAEEYVLRHYLEDTYTQLAENDSEDAHKQWAELKGRILKMHAPPDAPEDDEDSYWEKALEEEFKRDNPHLSEPQAQETAAPADPPAPRTIEDEDGWTHETPNLPEEINIQGEDPIPDE